MAEWYHPPCKQKFSNEWHFENHVCKGDSSKGSPMSQITCGICGNRMDTEKFNAHACVTKKKEMKDPQRIALFVSPRRVDTYSMRLAATEFRGAQYMARGMKVEEPFIKIAKEMGSSVMVCTSVAGISNLDREILKKADFGLMFPSKDSLDGKEILKFTMTFKEGENKDHRVPMIVYPER